MNRYFIEVAYRGTHFSGFQVQENSVTIQSEIEKAFAILHRRPVVLTGSSRTDAGVHALQNFFHFDADFPVNPQFVYKMNAILPRDIVVRNIRLMPPGAHCRFDATARAYEYRLHRFRNPFITGLSLYYPYSLDRKLMDEAASMVKRQGSFFAFSKSNTQVKHFDCRVTVSEFSGEGEELVYRIEGNRFLRGMVRQITASLLRVGRGRLTPEEFGSFFREPVRSGHSVPAHGLFLCSVNYPENYFPVPDGAFRPF